MTKAKREKGLWTGGGPGRLVHQIFTSNHQPATLLWRRVLPLCCLDSFELRPLKLFFRHQASLAPAFGRPQTLACSVEREPSQKGQAMRRPWSDHPTSMSFPASNKPRSIVKDGKSHLRETGKLRGRGQSVSRPSPAGWTPSCLDMSSMPRCRTPLRRSTLQPRMSQRTSANDNYIQAAIVVPLLSSFATASPASIKVGGGKRTPAA